MAAPYRIMWIKPIFILHKHNINHNAVFRIVGSDDTVRDYMKSWGIIRIQPEIIFAFGLCTGSVEDRQYLKRDILNDAIEFNVLVTTLVSQFAKKKSHLIHVSLIYSVSSSTGTTLPLGTPMTAVCSASFILRMPSLTRVTC